ARGGLLGRYPYRYLLGAGSVLHEAQPEFPAARVRLGRRPKGSKQQNGAEETVHAGGSDERVLEGFSAPSYGADTEMFISMNGRIYSTNSFLGLPIMSPPKDGNYLANWA